MFSVNETEMSCGQIAAGGGRKTSGEAGYVEAFDPLGCPHGRYAGRLR
jgi:hypothetical protein